MTTETAARRIKCRRNYMTAPVPGYAEPERVRVVRAASNLPGYYVVRYIDDATLGTANTVAMHESHIGSEVV
jgi:hypothetical protein